MNSTNERIYRSSDVIISLLSVLSKGSWKIGEIFNEGRSKHNLTNGIDKLSSYRESSQLAASRFSHHPVTVLSARYRVSQGVACNPWLDNCRFEWIVRRAARISSARAGNKTREALYSQRRVKHRLERATSSLFHVRRRTTRAFMQTRPCHLSSNVQHRVPRPCDTHRRCSHV